MPADRDLIAEGQPVGDAAGWQRLAGKWRDKAFDRLNELYVMYAVLEHTLSRIAEMEAAQRPPLGHVVIFDDPRTGPELQYDLRRLITNSGHAQEAYENLRYNDPTQAHAYHLAEVREVVQP